MVEEAVAEVNEDAMVQVKVLAIAEHRGNHHLRNRKEEPWQKRR